MSFLRWQSLLARAVSNAKLGAVRSVFFVFLFLGIALIPVFSAKADPLPPKEEAGQKTAESKAKVDTTPASFSKAIEKARRLIRRKRYAKAQIILTDALAIVPGHPLALYWSARSFMASKDKKRTIKALQALGESKHRAMPQWKVEARFELAFKELRGNKDFRLAVGIEQKPGQTPSLYERLVAQGGSWEQAPIACEEPMVSLVLKRGVKHLFDLVILSKCQGMKERTRLDGTWLGKAPNGLGLKFPNTGSAADDLSCQLELCVDAPGEECLRCQLDEGLEFLLQVVRR